jgi:hypothetical protein
MKDFRLAHRLDSGWSVGWQHKMSVSRGIFVQFFKCKILMSGKFVSFIASCTLRIVVGAEGGIKQWVRNNRNDDDDFEYLWNWLIFVVTVAS